MHEHDTDRAFTLFGRMLDLTREERVEFVSGLSADVRSELEPYLRAHEALEQHSPREPRPGDTIGRYTLEKLLGQGGFGQVWRACRPDLGPVALKLIGGRKLGARQLERFRREAAALSTCNHSGVATIHDYGDDPQPFLVMPLVEGVEITKYMRDRKLDLPARIGLMRDLCLAVQHVHSKGVIHRDLKPANVLVFEEDGAPRVRLIDFGIARFSDAQDAEREHAPLTEHGELLGTPLYMSPEQAGWKSGSTPFEVGFASDVFQIGRLLFEALTDERALRFSSRGEAALTALIQHLDQEPQPSPRERLRERGRGVRAVPRDLDAVVLRATAADPNLRYATVEDLTFDLDAWLCGRPVSARGTGVLEHLQRFMRRHRSVLTPAVALLLGLASVATVAERGRRRAEREESRLRRTLAAQTHHLESLSITDMGRALRKAMATQASRSGSRIADLVDQIDHVSLARSAFDASYLDVAETAFASSLQEEPLVLAELFCSLARVRSHLGMFPSALRVGERAFELRRLHLGAGDPTTLEAQLVLAEALRELGEHDRAEDIYSTLEERWEDLEGPHSVPALQARMERGLNHMARQDLKSAERVLAAVCADAELHCDPIPKGLIPAWRHWAQVLLRQLRFEESIEVGRLARDLQAGAEEADEIEMAFVNGTIGNAFAALASFGGEMREEDSQSAKYLAQAERLLKPSTALILDRLGDEHPQGLNSLNALSLLGRARYDTAAVLEYARRAWLGNRRLRGVLHAKNLLLQGNMVMALVDDGQSEEAEELALDTISLSERLGSPHPLIEPLMTGERGRARLVEKRFAEAEPLLLACYAQLVAVLGPDDMQTRQFALAIAQAYELWHEAEPSLGKEVDAELWANRGAAAAELSAAPEPTGLAPDAQGD